MLLSGGSWLIDPIPVSTIRPGLSTYRQIQSRCDRLPMTSPCELERNTTLYGVRST